MHNSIEHPYDIIYFCLYQLSYKKGLKMKTLFLGGIIYYETLAPINLGY